MRTESQIDQELCPADSPAECPPDKRRWRTGLPGAPLLVTHTHPALCAPSPTGGRHARARFAHPLATRFVQVQFQSKAATMSKQVLQCTSDVPHPANLKSPRAALSHHMSERIESQKKRFRSQRYVTPRTWTAVISSHKITKGDEVQKYEQASPVESDIRARYGDEA